VDGGGKKPRRDGVSHAGTRFLGVYALTADVLLSVMAPVMVAIGFIAARLLTRTQVMPAVAGLIGITASASVAILSGRAEDNFLLGFVVNALWIAALLVSLILRRPLAGWVVSVLRGDPTWRKKHGDVSGCRCRDVDVGHHLWASAHDSNSALPCGGGQRSGNSEIGLRGPALRCGFMVYLVAVSQRGLRKGESVVQ